MLSIIVMLIQLFTLVIQHNLYFLVIWSDMTVRMEKRNMSRWCRHLHNVHFLSFFCLSFFKAELAMWGECDNRRTSLYYISCNTSLSASEGKIWTKWEETWCFVHRKILSKFIFGRFIRTILMTAFNHVPFFSRCNSSILCFFVNIFQNQWPIKWVSFLEEKKYIYMACTTLSWALVIKLVVRNFGNSYLASSSDPL